MKVRGVVVTLRELSTGREYKTHHDRLSNPLFSGQKDLHETIPEHEQNANPEENLIEPKEDSEPVGNPEEALMRTRSGRVVRPCRHKNVDYTGVLLQFFFIPFQTPRVCQPQSIFSLFQIIFLSLSVLILVSLMHPCAPTLTSDQCRSYRSR